MNICIVCSLSCESECRETKDILMNMGFDITTPFDGQVGPLFDIQLNYLKEIDKADMVLVIPKRIDTKGTCNDNHCEWSAMVGESVSYEVAYAVHTNKPVIFGVLPFVGGDWR